MANNTNTNGTASAVITTKTNLDATIPLRVASSLKDALLILAAKEDRSLSNYVARLLAAHVEATNAANTATFTMSAKPKVKAKARKK